MNNFKIFKNKKILITGHTGFKGSWLTLCLKLFGAKILGVSKNLISNPSHFKICSEFKNVKSIYFDIKDFKRFKKIVNNFKPDFIFHLAAQAIVKKSLDNPIETWNSNTIGTLNLLEILRNYKKKVNVVIITSDKVYYNVEKKGAYKEIDRLGGKDPYSASKAGAEVAIKSYYESYLKFKKNIFFSVARAGNVIGGGDWSKNRLIPDCVRAWSKKKPVNIRNLSSTRPWQHVIEVINGYLILAINLHKKRKKINGETFNFGPSTKKNYNVKDCLKEMKKNWPTIKWKKEKIKNKFKEAGLLKLDSKKAFNYLNWKTILSFHDTIKYTAEWYKNFYKYKSEVITIKQIKGYYKKINIIL